MELNEQQIAEIQNLQRQLQMTVMQKQQFQMQLEEMKAANEELAKSKGAVFRAAGSLLIESTKEEAAKDLKEKMETLDMRVSITSKQEEKLKARFEEMRQKIEGPGAGAKKK